MVARQDDASPVPISSLLDDLSSRVATAIAQGENPTQIHVEPRIYAAIAEAKARSLARGNPLLLFGLELVADPSVSYPLVT
jgi:hypothetical protein